MKKLFFLSLTLLIVIVGNSQNWMSINKDEKYTYCSGNNVYKTIWTDSIIKINSDSIFFLNKVIKKVKDGSRLEWPDYAEAYYLENQSQFFLSQIIYYANSDIVMKENDSIQFLIKPSAKLNETWVFDSLKSDTAKVIGVLKMNIFGNTDSVKVIKLSSNDTIIISKNYGIIKFPVFDTSHQHMNLVGIEGRNIGLIIPKFKDFYNFNAGDVFYYKTEGFGHVSYSLEYQKITVKRKITKGNSISYLSSFQSHKTKRNMGITEEEYTNKDSLFEYIDNADDFLNKYSDQIINLETIGDKYKPVIITSSKSIIDTIFAITKSYQLNPLEKKSGSDTIIDHGGYFPPHALNGQSSSVFGSNLGLISSDIRVYAGGSEYSNSIKLIGCIKDGIVHGTIVSDSLLCSNTEVPIENSILKVYPNPANIEITIEYLRNSKDGTLTILNLTGQELVRQQIRNSKTQIDISNLKSGEYFIKFITDKTVVVRKIIIE